MLCCITGQENQRLANHRTAMAVHPIDYAASPDARPRRAEWLRSRFSRWHVGIALALWLVFSGVTLVIVLTSLDDVAQRPVKAAATTAGTVLGPMTGAISRDLQSCCLRFSLQLLPVCLGALGGAIMAQLVVPTDGRWRRAFRLFAWAGGLFVWFAGGIVSFAHALS